MKVTSRIHLLPAVILAVGLLIGCPLASIVAGNHFWNFYGLLLIVALACILFGVFVGLIFGVPKLNDKFDPSTNYLKDHKYMPNTNLEEMSDWLTKIIVGVSLTQLASIPGYLNKVADFVLPAGSCDFNCEYGKAIVISVIIYFLVSGFLVGYIYTRLYLPRLLSLMEDKEKVTEEKNRKQVEAEIWEAAYNEKAGDTDTSGGHTAAKNLALGSFTQYERHVLKMIADANNKFIPKTLLKFDDFAAVNVLLRKGIIKIAEGGEFRLGVTISIIDDQLLKTVQNYTPESDPHAGTGASTPPPPPSGPDATAKEPPVVPPSTPPPPPANDGDNSGDPPSPPPGKPKK